MKQNLQLRVKSTADLTTDEYTNIVSLCSRAFEEDYGVYLQSFQQTLYGHIVHVLGQVDDQLVTHALWVPRMLQLADGTQLQTAYVEGVATEEAYRRRGYAAAVMQRVADEIRDFDIGGLSPFSVAYYARLGWECWRGSLLIRQDGQLLPTLPDEDGDEECLMILRLPKTADLDLDNAISIEWREGDVW